MRYEQRRRGNPFSTVRLLIMSTGPVLATIPLPSHHHVRIGLEAQLRQCWAIYSALPTEANRYQLVRLERLLQQM